MILISIIFYIVGLFILYLVIYSAVKDGIDKSEVGQLLRMKYGEHKKVTPVSDEEIEKELEEQFKNDEN
ncbi:hypothetical protein ACFOZY_15445 [Chungangia koreensis]|uniref:MbpR n=1 Tax=Chungangia koreensis TaxID=752657 RepID=A0ABV8X9X0_9LACT